MATYHEISVLREEALTHGDLVQARICDIALYGELERSALEGIAEREHSRLVSMTADEALAECDRVIEEAAADD